MYVCIYIKNTYVCFVFAMLAGTHVPGPIGLFPTCQSEMLKQPLKGLRGVGERAHRQPPRRDNSKSNIIALFNPIGYINT